MKPSQPISASAGVVVKPRLRQRHVGEVPLLASRYTAPQAAEPNSSSVTAGPAAAILNSSPAVSRFAAHVREPAEEPQVDARDRDAQPSRHQRVPELVQDQRGEVAERPAPPPA